MKHSISHFFDSSGEVMLDRRHLLQQVGGIAMAGFIPAGLGLLATPKAEAAGWDPSAFTIKGVDQTIKALGSNTPPKSTDNVNWGNTPEIAENGMVVPVSITSKIPNTESIAILIEKNPNTLSAVFSIPAGTDPSVITRVKMSETSLVYALIKAGGQYHLASREIKVTLGGCGG